MTIAVPPAIPESAPIKKLHRMRGVLRKAPSTRAMNEISRNNGIKSRTIPATPSAPPFHNDMDSSATIAAAAELAAFFPRSVILRFMASTPNSDCGLSGVVFHA